MIALLTLAAPAHAFNWTQNSSPTYHLRVQDFSAAERAEIDAGAAAWNTGAGTNVRGSSHSFTRGSNASSFTGQGNTQNEVYRRPNGWFKVRGLGGAIAATVFFPKPIPPWEWEVDVVFNSDKTFCTRLPSDPLCSGFSIGQIAVHEFGHFAGWDHEDDTLASMNSFYPNGGDLGGAKYRIHEDDAWGMMVKYSGSSTGRNLMLSKFKKSAVYGDSEEMWRNQKTYSKSGGWTLITTGGITFPNLPLGVRAVHTGTGSTSSLIEWRATTGACVPGAGYLAGSCSPTMTTNTPYVVGPNTWNFSAVPTGDYRMCVSIDPNNTVGESSGTDNTVGSRGSAFLRIVL